MNTAVEQKPEWFVTKEIEQPPDVVKATVSSISGKLPSELTKAGGFLSTDLMNKRFMPTDEDDMLLTARVVKYNKFNYLAQATTPEDFVQDKTVVVRHRSNKTIYDELKAIFEKFPKVMPQRNKLKTLEGFLTPDAHLDAPTDVDPRVDDGIAPPAPSGLKLQMENGDYRLTFTPVATEDVIGYRLYMSKDFGPFARFSGLVVHAGDNPTFLIEPRTANDVFYVTAVDVAGNESTASNYAFSGSTTIDPNLLPPVTEDPPGGDSTPAAGAPTEPQGISGQVREEGVGILLQWTSSPSSDNVTSYNVYYSSTADGSFSLIGSTERTRFEYISFPSEGWYRVTAVNANGESAPSQTVEIKPAE